MKWWRCMWRLRYLKWNAFTHITLIIHTFNRLRNTRGSLIVILLLHRWCFYVILRKFFIIMLSHKIKSFLRIPFKKLIEVTTIDLSMIIHSLSIHFFALINNFWVIFHKLRNFTNIWHIQFNFLVKIKALHAIFKLFINFIFNTYISNILL